ncbi:signal peptidase II [Pseudoalteromonas obscura]|uniref:Lipoprotein signal peptidase n=1 Tax=Pseudoalteromonas obscura TaxID=3048491 RepID=A0ABT7ET40_9GAMM|nr:signal peptidase II [Pseudoalteromonas sp. P94(2023)]MDK2598202.1 signal peptidase II [Pseudoalteromonas sp. P94(2023)]
MNDSKAGHIALVCIVCLLLDQGSKWWASDNLVAWQMTSYLGDMVRIGYTENLGVFLSVGAGLSPGQRMVLFIGVVGLFLLALLSYMVKSRDLSKLQLTSLSLIFAGGIGNLLDRIFNHGAVIDFINLGVGSIRTGIFNIADVVILVGAMMIILCTPFQSAQLK